MAQVVEHMSKKHKVFKPQYCTPHQKKSEDKFVLTRDDFTSINLAYSW
jgi:hypothetical protein